MATSVINQLAVWGLDGQYVSGSYSTDGGNTSGFIPGNFMYAQEINKAFRNATILPYAIAQMLTTVQPIDSNFTITFDVSQDNVGSFASTFKSVFNSYIYSAIKVFSAVLADGAKAFNLAQVYKLEGVVTGSVISNKGWTMSTTIEESKIISSMISDGAISESKIAAFAITTGKIASGAITGDKIGSGSVETSNLNDSCVTTVKIATQAITSQKLATSAVTTNKISSGAVTNDKIANPFILFNNYSNTMSISLGASISMYDLFAFNPFASGVVKLKGVNPMTPLIPAYFYIENDAGDQSSLIPNWCAMYDKELTSINFPKCSIVGEGAFAYCSNLSGVSLPVAKEIKGAFAYCTKLSIISLPSCTMLYSGRSPYNHSAYYGAFEGCSSLANISIPNLSVIGYKCFANTGITDAYFSKVTRTESSCFNSCNSLSRIELPSCSLVEGTLMNGGGNALTLLSLPSLTEVNSILLDKNDTNAFSNLTTINLQNVKSINSKLIRGANNTTFTNLSNIYIPNAEIIGDNAFMSMTGLKNLTTNGNNNLSKVTTIRPQAFYNCGISRISLPNCTTIVSDTTLYGNFAYCSNLTSISLPSFTGILSGAAFANCTALSYIELNCTQLERYNYGVFINCTALQTVKLRNCSSIVSSTFTSCIALKYLYLWSNQVCRIEDNNVFNYILANEGKIYLSTTSMRDSYMQSYSSYPASLFVSSTW